MPTVKAELVDGHRYADVLRGFEISRVFRVTELTEAPERQLIEAVEAAGIPSIGDVYPGTTGILVVRRESEPNGPNAARVTCIYSAEPNVSTWNQPEPVANDGQDVKQISAGVRERTTTRDIGGNPMLLNPPAQYAGGGWKPYLSEAKFLVPAGELVFERVETSPPVSRMRLLVGTVNSLLIGSYAAKTLLFAAYNAISTDGGRKWQCTYTFRYDVAGWFHTDRYHAPDGRVPEDAAEASFEVIDSTDFSTFGLDFSDAQTPIS